jgi:hypothetical protein
MSYSSFGSIARHMRMEAARRSVCAGTSTERQPGFLPGDIDATRPLDAVDAVEAPRVRRA